MNWNMLLIFGISLGVYFIGLTAFALIKRYINKKKFDKEKKEHEKEENK